MQKLPHMVRSTAIVIFFFSISKLTGFVKLILMTDKFGLSTEADALTAAIQLPELFMQMAAGGALSAALIPVYSAYVTDRSESEQHALGSTIITLVGLVLGGLSLLVLLAAPWIARVVLVPHFSAESQLLVADLMRIVVFGSLLFGLSSVISALLHTHHHFTLPAVADVAIDLGQIVGILLLADRLGVYGVAWGSILGSLCHLLVQLPAIVNKGIEIRPKLALQLAGVKEVLHLMGPRLITIGAAQFSDIIVIRSASQLPEGSVSGYFYTILLTGIPISLFGWAFGIVIFPTMAEQFNRSDHTALKQTSTAGFLTLAALMLPAAVGLVALGQPGIKLIFERGEFGANSTALMYSITIVMSLRIVANSGLVVFERIFYARHDTRTVMWFYLGWFAAYVGSALVLIPTAGVIGLTISFSLSFMLMAIGMFVWLQWSDSFFDQRQIGVGIGRILLACLMMTVPIRLFAQLNLPTLAYVVLAVGAGGLVYLICLGALARNDLARWRLAFQQLGIEQQNPTG